MTKIGLEVLVVAIALAAVAASVTAWRSAYVDM